MAIADLDRDGLGDVLVCDALRNVVAWIRQSPRGVFTEQPLVKVVAPAHVEAVDFDKDGDTDVLVGALGFLFPNNNRVGSVLLLENDGRQGFTSRTLVAEVARVADARAADLDGDGDLDVSVAGFGYDDGETSWLENRGDWKFDQHVLQRLSGRDQRRALRRQRRRRPDIVTLVSQEWEEIWAFVNDGNGAFAPRMVWGSTNPDFGSSWLSMVDLDRRRRSRHPLRQRGRLRVRAAEQPAVARYPVAGEQGEPELRTPPDGRSAGRNEPGGGGPGR